MRRRATHKGLKQTGSLLPVLALSWLALPVQALDAPEDPGRFDPGSPASNVREPPRMAPDKSADRIIRAIERKYDARVVRQEVKERDGRRMLVLRLDDGKRVWSVRVDPETGKEL